MKPAPLLAQIAKLRIAVQRRGALTAKHVYMSMAMERALYAEMFPDDPSGVCILNTVLGMIVHIDDDLGDRIWCTIREIPKRDTEAQAAHARDEIRK